MKIFIDQLFLHNTWANLKMVEKCATLTDTQLDAQPHGATRGTIRETVYHIVNSQVGYLSLLSGKPRLFQWQGTASFDDLRKAAQASGDGLIALIKDDSSPALRHRLQTKDGYLVEPWVVLVQVINHATEHREQINSMLTALGIAPLELDGWSFGDATGALTPINPTP